MDYFPAYIDLRNKPCLVIGGGEVAARKIELLLKVDARITVISPEISNKLQPLLDEHKIETRIKAYEESDLGDFFLIIAATDDAKVNKQVSKQAHAMNRLVNVVDNPHLCNFIVPSIVDRTPVQVSISTGGASPVLARMLRSKLETEIPSAYGRLGQLCEDYRDKVKKALPDGVSRKRFWEDVLAGEVGELVLAGKDELAQRKLEKALAESAQQGQPAGEVYLVGGGPGDPDLLTFRALRLMQKADVIVHDRLVSAEVLSLCRKDAEKIYVGKERDNHALPQEDINQLLVRLAKEGHRVCRLKGGDPFIFGRGGEEIDTLAAEGINFQVVPAVTAASGVSSYAGIPLTHRDYAQSVIFTTGHLKHGTTDINWNALVHPKQTIVFYMGLHGIDLICNELIAHGMTTSTPIAMVQQGTTRNQRIVTGTLADMPEKVRAAELKPPTLIIVGEVVKLQSKLNWFTPNPD